ncbi:helix-turn-helix transcriptional regulator [Lacticaseibacillus daqingensis]|uniref:helix-turn-helix transcriptional regulator n=1 Tax=Lacticaseibacillus daqingensis TaxID=2486014 RepID=UPI000F79AA51|nr:hypothetical protein [Lacticaseibacillus daqingensis]
MQEATKMRRSTGELITQTEAADMIGGVTVFSPNWYDLISDPSFPRQHHLTPTSRRGYYKRSEIQTYIDNI